MNVIEPKQIRSQQTMARILEACDTLLADGTFEETSMQAIAERAGMSVGNLYNRFSNKEALISHLIERMQARQREFFAERLGNRAHLDSLHARLEFLADAVATGLKTNGGLLKAIAVRELTGTRLQNEATDRHTADFMRGIADWLHGAGGEVQHPDGRDACLFAASTIVFGIQYTLIFDTPLKLMGPTAYRARLIDSAFHYLTAGATT